MSDSILMRCVGDVVAIRPDLDEAFAKTKDQLKEADITFGVFEAVLSKNKGIHNVSSCCAMPCSSYPELAASMKRNGFDVVSFASNHALDYGRQAFLDTLDSCENAGLKLVGAGRNEEEAKRFIVIEEQGTKIAILSYCSILPQGFWALGPRPGVNPARAYNVYIPKVHDQPGTQVMVQTAPDHYDLMRMRRDIAEAKKVADIVMVSMHWGIHFTKAEISEYQREYAYAAIDAGADIILGHHAHVIKPIEVYHGKVIFYSFGNFVQEEFDNMVDDLATLGVKRAKESEIIMNVGSISEGFKAATRTFPPDSYMGLMAQIEIKNKTISRVSYKPLYLPVDCIPYFPTPGDEWFDKITSFVDEINKMEEINTKFTIEGDEVVVNII